MADRAPAPRALRPAVMIAATWAARLAVAAVFVYAAVPKVIELQAFADAIANYQVFGHWSLNALAALVPMLELVGAASILTGWKRRAGGLLLGGLTLAFIALIASVMVRGIDVACGCFGRPDQAATLGWPELLRDLALLPAIALAAVGPTSGAPDQRGA